MQVQDIKWEEKPGWNDHDFANHLNNHGTWTTNQLGNAVQFIDSTGQLIGLAFYNNQECTFRAFIPQKEEV